MKSRWFLFPVLCIWFCSENVFSQTHVFLPGNISRVRAFGMAGAVNALEDDFGAAAYNPANYTFYGEPKSFRMTLLLAPVTPAVIVQDDTAFWGRQVSNREKIYSAVLSVLKAVNFSFNSIDVGFVFGEPLLMAVPSYERERFLHMRDVYDNHYDAMIIRIRLAEQVAFGASLHLIYLQNSAGKRIWKFASAYGVFMQPSRYLRFGVSLFSFANDATTSRLFLEELRSDAVNVGLTLATPSHFNASLDIRNLAVGNAGPREQYFLGLEQTIFGQIAIRGGSQYQIDSKSFTYTAGIGLFDLNVLFPQQNRFKHANFALNYAIISKKIVDRDYLLHAFSLNFRL